ncbi:Uncharacterized protein Rs2_21633 [Raphanus sativus]|uniref:Uncharacterized protein LOC108859316 isoform X2 n=1 Tax=Raphanus sativus TaxID=3726 RepID=A0A6J0NV90_RAPSA|nr:uncharacterized protein LOC108859316 isoform X2 [Raphanus sativus]XP_018488709.1 uncharacterized protein LOC108859316 isoform X2 [Raphanus sativus]XP_056842332.1 uncharacterized protein LOC108859316 isoform X2 [Raphanus sativus]KAJ4894839.1 Uncharacterized protein Rs2_21633 [Raphanus sativus]
MPPGAKKRKALKKKQQQESTVTNINGSNGDNRHDDGQGRQDDRESDDSSLSSPASQGNGEFGGTKDPSGLVKDTAKEISDHPTQGLGGIAIALQRGINDKKNIVDLASQDGKVAAGTSRNVESIREPQAPVSSEEKRLLLPGPPTSWLSCCGLFDALTGSDS